MRKIRIKLYGIGFPLLIALCVNAIGAWAQVHPNIMLTQQNIAAVRVGVSKYPMLRESFKTVKAQADKALGTRIEVPEPTDGGGGYTHERHKQNYQEILACGIAYQVTGELKYANFVKSILLDYAGKYESWPVHPKRKTSNQPGRIFWQILNDCVWQVNVIQGYDLVYNAIPVKDRNTIEQHLFMPMLKFLTVDSYNTFNRIHNHGTWCVAAVGMTGYVLNKMEYVEMALKGSAKDGKTGYLTQLDQLFSPNGYYTEGPYYQRYAMLPFMLFAKAIHQNQPQMGIFKYREGVLLNAIHTALQLTYTNGAFFPINDAIKDKTFESEEMVYSVDIGYADILAQPELLDVAERQHKVLVSDAGLKIAKAVAEKKAKPFVYQSMWIKDGANGDEGGLGVLRNGENSDQQCLVFKGTSQGMGHGHFDRLNILYYDNGAEVFPDYGSARFINIESKSGGDYLPENKTWAKQTVAHNTVIVDEQSHFNGDPTIAQKYHPDLVYFVTGLNFKAISAREQYATPGVDLKRTSILFNAPELKKALLIDVFQAQSATKHQYDLPFWYRGTITDASFKIAAIKDNLKALGKSAGYEHLWLNSINQLNKGAAYVTFLNNRRFYTVHFITVDEMQVKNVSLGANDPDMSLRPEKAFMLSTSNTTNQTFVSVTEIHGETNPIEETTIGAKSEVTALQMTETADGLINVSFKVKDKSYAVKINPKEKELITIN